MDMIISSQQFGYSIKLIMILAPIALYFLMLGLLNTRKCPQLLTGRQDFALLSVALSPIALGLAVQYLGVSTWVLLATASLIAVAIALLAPKTGNFVIYNLPMLQGRKILINELQKMGYSVSQTANYLDINSGQGRIEISNFPLLRNISFKLTGLNRAAWEKFESRLEKKISSIEAEPSPAAVSLLLTATAMIVAPAALLIQNTPEIVRLLSDLI